MKLEPKQLSHLATIAACGSFSRAAAQMNVSQPALSNSIAQLERAAGGRVLERGRNGARLTDLGTVLTRHAHALNSQLVQAAEEIRLKKLGGHGPLTVGVTPVTAASLVPDALVRLKRELPTVFISIVEGVFDEAMTMLRAGEVDLFVGPINVYPGSRDIVEERLASDPLELIVRPQHPLARRRSASLHDLRDAEWTLPSEHSAFRRHLEALFVTANVPWPTFYIATNSMTSLKAIVMSSDYVTIMPRRLVRLECKAGQLRTLSLKDRGSRRDLGLSWMRHRDLSPVAERFAEILRDIARKEIARRRPSRRK